MPQARGESLLQFTENRETLIDSESLSIAEDNAQSDKRLPTSSQIARILHDFFKIIGDNEAFLDSSDLSNVQWKTTTFTDRLADNISESL